MTARIIQPIAAGALLWLGGIAAPCAAIAAVQPSASRSAVSAAAGEIADPPRADGDAELLQPPSVDDSASTGDAGLGIQLLPPTTAGLTLTTLEEIALSNNPAIRQAAANMAALRGKWVQAGLAPNPTVGYVGGEIGSDGSAGQQGGYLGQQFVTASKLQRDRNIVAAEIGRSEQQLAAVQLRVRTDVRISYYQALLAQRRVQVTEDLTAVAGSAVQASQRLYDAQEIPLAGLLQSEIAQQNAVVALRTAGNAQMQAWRELSAVTSADDLPLQPLAGDVSQLPAALDWQQQQLRVLEGSPEVAAAMANVSRARRVLNRACVEAVPDVSAQVSVQYDDASRDTIAGVQIGMPLPLWNRNQGGIRQARSEVAAAVRNVERVERDLSRRLADAFRRYADAVATTETYAREILPRSERTLALVRRGYDQGETGYLALLAAQQTYFEANLAYLDALGGLWQSYTLIDGLLLNESLAAPVE